MCLLCWSLSLVFLFKQKTAYEMRISDWSSDVCSSDLHFLAACKTRERCLDERVGTDIGACRKHRIVQPLRGEEFGSDGTGQHRLDADVGLFIFELQRPRDVEHERSE